MTVHLAAIPVFQHSALLTELVPRLSVKPAVDDLTEAQKAYFELLNQKLLQVEQQILQDVLALNRQMSTSCPFSMDDLRYSAAVSFYLHQEDKHFNDDYDNTLCLLNLDFSVENKQEWSLPELSRQMQQNAQLTLHKNSAELMRADPLAVQYALAQEPHSVFLHYLLKEVLTYRNADNAGSLGLLDLLRIGAVFYELNIKLGLAIPLQLSYPQSLHHFASKVSPYCPSEQPRKNHAAFKARDEKTANDETEHD